MQRPGIAIPRLVCLGIVLFVVLSLRVAARIADPQFWAEDGLIFFQESLTQSPVSAIGVTYAGYLHVIPRLTAVIAAAFPVLWAPAIYQWVALALEALSCLFFALPRFRTIVSNDALRFACCFIFAAVPYGFALPGNLANLQWYLALVVVLLLAVPPKQFGSLTSFIAATATVIALALTSPETIVFLPLTIERAVVTRGRPRLFFVALLCSTLVQLAEFVTHPESSPGSPDGVGYILLGSITAVSYKVFLTSFFGEAAVAALNAAPIIVIVLVSALFLAIYVFVCRGIALRPRLAIAYLFTVPATVFVATRHISLSFSDPKNGGFWGGERYTLLATFVLIVAVAVLVEKIAERYRRPLLAAPVMLLLFSYGIWSNFYYADWPDYNWPLGARAIEHWKDTASADAVAVPVNPPSWMIRLPKK